MNTVLVLGVVNAGIFQAVPWCERLISPVISNWPLIAVAIGGIFVARSTLHAIRWQAEETAKATKAMRDSLPLQKEAADAALKNAQAVINSERPWLLLEIKFAEGYGTAFTISFRNFGRTPAEVVGFCQHLEPGETGNDLGLPPEPKYYDEGEALKHTRIVAQGRRWTNPGEGGFVLPQNFIADQWKDIQESKIRAVYWGRLRYRDLIEQPRTIHELEKPDQAIIHETCFCYWWSPRVQDFIIGGPEGYNKHT